MKRKVALHNLGCKVNAYELEAMQQQLLEAGYEIVPFAPGADAYVINTCTVTNIADRKSRQMLHKAKKMNPQALVVAAGCYVQDGMDKLEADDCVDVLLGNNRKKELVQVLEEAWAAGHASRVIDINKTREYESLSVSRTAEHTRAYIKVQDGCNQFCSYCIIPFTRGRVRSRDKGEVCREVETLAQNGYREVVLTGIHLSSYGVDFPEENKESLLSLIQAVHEISGISRIRLGSLEPRIVTEDFVAAIAALPKVCPHFHLSLQSGSSRTLLRMNRKYTAQEYARCCGLLRKYYEAPALTTDVITGFPGETEEDFEESRAFVEEIGFFETHIFPYSRREGTRAAAMEEQLPEAVKKARSRVLLDLDAVQRRRYMEQFLGKTLEILLEEQKEIDGQSLWVGHTREYLPAAVCPPEKGELGGDRQKDFSPTLAANQLLRARAFGISGEGFLLCRILSE